MAGKEDSESWGERERSKLIDDRVTSSREGEQV